MESEKNIQPPKKRLPKGILRFVAVALVTALVTGMTTYTVTTIAERNRYQKDLQALQASESPFAKDGEDLIALAQAILSNSLYAETLDSDEMAEAALRAYVNALGDPYAAYYDEQEYQALTEQKSGSFCGIGVGVSETSVEVAGEEIAAFLVTSIYRESQAGEAGVAVGDYIYAVRDEIGSVRTVSETGYDGAVALIRGEENTSVELFTLRPNQTGFESQTVTVKRVSIETVSVSGEIDASHPTVGIVTMKKFDLTTPTQLRQTVESLQGQGAVKFVFDLRGNGGGDLYSLCASLAFFLEKGDLILQAIDRSGTTCFEEYANPVSLGNPYENCSIAEEDIGIFRELEIVTLCDGNTASAAEIFVETLRNYQVSLAVVGTTTFGKGVMQTTQKISFPSGRVGYVKLTAYSYLTASGKSYHGKGITPDLVVERGTELTDSQMCTAIEALVNR